MSNTTMTTEKRVVQGERQSEGVEGRNIPKNNTSASRNLGGRFADHLCDDIRPSMFAELQLLILTFCTGMQGM